MRPRVALLARNTWLLAKLLSALRRRPTLTPCGSFAFSAFAGLLC